METTEISTRFDSSGPRAWKKKGIDDTVCRCIVFYLRGEKKKRQVFGAKKCKLDFQGAIAGLYVTYVTAAMLVVKNKNTSLLWELISIFM